MFVSEIISLQVVSIWDKSFEGIVENVLFESKSNKLKFLKIYNEIDNFTYFLKPSDIYKISNSTILLKNNSVLNPAKNLELCSKACFNPIGATLYDFEGINQGNITDLILDEKFVIQQVVANQSPIDIKNVFVFGENISFLKPEKQINLSAFSPKKKIKISKSEISVRSLDKTLAIPKTIKKENISSEKPKNPLIDITPQEKTPQKLTTLTAPKRIITDYRFLINRILIDNIVLQNGELLIRKNSRINSQIIEKARTFGKLIELTQKSK